MLLNIDLKNHVHFEFQLYHRYVRLRDPRFWSFSAWMHRTPTRLLLFIQCTRTPTREQPPRDSLGLFGSAHRVVVLIRAHEYIPQHGILPKV